MPQPRARLLYAPPTRVIDPASAVAETVRHLSGSDAPRTEPGDFHPHVGSPHLHENHLDRAEESTPIDASSDMPELTTPVDVPVASMAVRRPTP